MAQAAVVGTVGVKALTKDWAKLTANTGPLYDALSAAGRAAAEPVAAATRSAMFGDTTPALSPPHLTDDIRVTATRSGAAVRMGRSSIRWAGWVEFGGTRRNPVTSTRDFNPRGRYLFPSAMQLSSVSARLYSDATQKALNSFRWTNTGTDPGGVHD